MYVAITSLHAATIGPEAIAGSIPILEKKIGDNVPSVVAVTQAPNTPALTILATKIGSIAIC